jgi:hypothetical protein
MALSGTSLTVTTLTTAGLLTNNTSGQVSSVTGSTLAALLGGAPTFTGLTLSGLGTGILKVTAGVISLASAGTDYQTPISAGNNMAFTGSAIGTVTTPSFTGLTLSGLATGILKVTAGVVSIAPTSDYQYSQGSNITISGGTISTSATPSFTGLTLSGLSTGLLKVTAGVVGLAAAGTDYLSALTAGTNITITNNTIATTTLPTFAGINCSSVGNQNTLYGTNAGINLLSNGSGGNTFIGFQTGMNCTAGGLNMSIGNGSMSNGATGLTGQGFNMAIGTASLYNLAGTASHNIGIGYLTGFDLTTGSSNVYIGDMANASSGTVSNEGVINLSGSSTAGRGANTMLINASSGLYSYTPYSMNLWNNNAATISQVEQWVLNNTANSGIANIGTTPTITSGVITNIPVGVYNFNITGSFYGSSQTYYPTLQYKANGGSFVRIALAFPSFGGGWTCPFSINANIRISNVADAIRLWYDTSNPGPYTNVGSIPVIYYGNYLPRYMTITFISL